MKRLLLLLLLIALPAHAEFLPELPRALTRTDSASRDAPVLEFTDDSRPHAVLGLEVGLWRWQHPTRQTHWSVLGLVAADNATSRAPMPDELVRWMYGTSLSFLLPWLGEQTPLEISVGLYRQRARTLGGFVLTDPIRPDALPFGGSGTFIELELATRRRLGPLEGTLRLGNRLHLQALALLIGQRVWADVLGDFLLDPLLDVPALDISLRWPLFSQVQPLLAVHGELQIPLDSYVRLRGYVRALAGVGLRGQHGELTPFGALDVGSGPGLLVNRTELRLLLGVRYAPN